MNRSRLIFCLLFFIPFSIAAQNKVEAENFISQGGPSGVQVVYFGEDEGGSGAAVGYWEQGDYIIFNLTVPAAGYYTLRLRTATSISEARYEIRESDEKLLATVYPPNTGSFSKFTTISVSIPLTAGTHTLKYVCAGKNPGADINWFSWTFDRAFGMPGLQAGADTLIIIPDAAADATAILYAQAMDDNGKIVSYQWQHVSGRGGVLSSPESARTVVRNLAPGTHVFKVKAKDNEGHSVEGNMKVVVKKCSTGKKMVFEPIGGNGELYLTAPGFNNPYNYHTPDISPGDTIALNSRYPFRFVELNGFKGAPGCPIVVTSDTGVVHIEKGIKLFSCAHIKITGRDRKDTSTKIPSDDGHEKYRIDIRGTEQSRFIAIVIMGKSSHVEVDRIRAEKIWYGVWAKTDPFQDPNCDTSYNYPNYIMDDIDIHHCYFKDVTQDVMYLGNTDPLGERTYTCNGKTVHFIPMRVSNFNIHHNRILVANRTAIQLSGAETGLNQIHHNYISDIGYELNQQQGTGISLGGMTRNCHVFNNKIRNTFLYGIFDLGCGINYIENNEVDSSGYLDIRKFILPVNLDSLFSPGTGMVRQGSYLKNVYNGGITNIAATTKGSIPHNKKTCIIRYNRLGANSSSRAPNGNISFMPWGPPEDWTTKSIVCGNRLLDGKTPVSPYRFDYRGNSWPEISANCSLSTAAIEAAVKEDALAGRNPSGNYSKLMMGGAAVLLVGVIYFVYRKLHAGHLQVTERRS